MAGRTHRKRTRRRSLWIAGIAVLAALVAGALAITSGVSFTTTHKAPPPAAAASPAPPVVPLTVVGTTPQSGATGVAASSQILVTLSTPLAAGSPLPTLSPALPGTWQAVSSTILEFVAAGPLVPGSTETLTVPGGPNGLVGARGQLLAASDTVTFKVATGSTLRLQELLAELGYLPLNFTPLAPMTSPRQEADAQYGTFTWRWANQPTSLTSLWTQGSPNVILTGALMSFQSQHGLTANGIASPQVWADLLQAAAQGQSDPQPYGYVSVSEKLPERLWVYQNGVVKYTTLVNTGVAAAATQIGTYPVYLRYRTQTMTGTNPNGTHYSDPGIPWISYFYGGDALHGFVRASYGFPQSDGCVEMPPAHAQVVWPMTPIGTLVTVA